MIYKMQNWESFNYREVWEILSFKDGYAWKTKTIGFIHEKDSDKYPPDKYILSPVSINDEDYTILDPYLKEGGYV